MILEVISIFVLILIPNFLRQVSYYFTLKRTKKYDFCDSFETLKLMKARKFYLGYLEEIAFGIAYTIFYFYLPILSWLAWGWVFDALQDVTLAFYFYKKMENPFKKLASTLLGRELLREIFLPYVLVGPILYVIGVPLIPFCVFAIMTEFVLVILIIR